MLGPIDWHAMFVPDTPLLEIFVRGSVVYLALFIMLRCVLKRQAGGVGISDILVIVLIADASQNAMAHDYTSLPDGIFLVMTIIFWNYVIDWLSFHAPWFSRLVEPAPLPIIKSGRMLKTNMRSELITVDELMSLLRQQGVDSVSEVKIACMEPDGKLSVVTHEAARKKAQKHGDRKKQT